LDASGLIGLGISSINKVEERREANGWCPRNLDVNLDLEQLLADRSVVHVWERTADGELAKKDGFLTVVTRGDEKPGRRLSSSCLCWKKGMAASMRSF
jgi:hypothetical protein